LSCHSLNTYAGFASLNCISTFYHTRFKAIASC
jgi:hypothetical protein